MRFNGKFALPLVVAGAFAATLLSGCGDQGDGTVTVSSIAGSTYYTAGNVAQDYDSLTGIEGGSTGLSDLTRSTYAEKTAILGALEEYAVDNLLTGMPLFENGGYVMYNDRITKGTDEYITGYGFGILREGSINTSVSVGEDNYPTYYHSYDASDPASISAIDDSGSQVDTLNGYMALPYFSAKMNADKTGYEYYGALSTYDTPFMVDGDTITSGAELTQTDYSDTWRVYVRTGESGGVAYRTGSSLANRQAYDGTYVTLDDYVNALKILLNGKYGYYRGNEIANSTGASTFVGAASYYDATAELDPWDEEAEEAWEEVGITSGTDDNGDYLQFQLGTAVNPFFAMYYLSTTLYSPINIDFFRLVTNDGDDFDNYGKYNSSATTTPVDNILSVGPYYLSSWTADVEIVFSRNPNYWEIVEDSNVYSIEGVYVDILTAAGTDENAGIQQFLSDNLDVVSIPSDYLDRYKNDPRTVSVPGDSVFKLNVNSCDQETWNELFGDRGIVAQTGDDSYVCKPWMANDDFVKGIFFSIDRETFANNHGTIPSINYFSDNYISDPENSISYNETEEHANAIADFWGDTVSTYGYSQTLAGYSFDDAIEALLESGDIANGDTLEIDIWWMYQSNITNYGDQIASYIQTAFNGCEQAQAHNLTLQVNNLAVTVWSDVYYQHLLVGQFDLGFGSISGNAMDPLNFMEVLKSNNSSGFTLNWGKDTSALDLSYDSDGDGTAETWSFDTLWAAADHGVVTYKGQEVPPYVFKMGDATLDEELNLTATFEYSDLYTEMYERAAANDSDAQTILDLLANESYAYFPDYLIISDDNNFTITLTGPSFSGTQYGVGTLLAGDDGSIVTSSTWTPGSDDENDNSGTWTVTISGDVIAPQEPDYYIDFYCYGSISINGGTEITAYGIPEIIFA